jgi:hypothetical protein
MQGTAAIISVRLFFHPSDEDLSLGAPALREKPRSDGRFGEEL